LIFLRIPDSSAKPSLEYSTRITTECCVWHSTDTKQVHTIVIYYHSPVTWQCRLCPHCIICRKIIMLKTLLKSIILCPETSVLGFATKSIWNIMELFVLHVIRHTTTNGPPVQTRPKLDLRSCGMSHRVDWYLPAFRGNLKVPSSWVSCPRIVGLDTRLTRYHISKDRNLDSHSRQNLKVTSTECQLDWMADWLTRKCTWQTYVPKLTAKNHYFMPSQVMPFNACYILRCVCSTFQDITNCATLWFKASVNCHFCKIHASVF